MDSDNPSRCGQSAGKAQFLKLAGSSPVDLGNWVAGFVEGEGSFNVPVRRERDRGLPWRVSLSFNVSQVGHQLPQLLKATFGTGTVRDRGDGIHYFEVTRPLELEDRVFPFFERFPLRGPKSCDLAVFREITALVLLGRHLSPTGIGEILALRGPMNRGGKRRYAEEEILDVLRLWESSEAIRKAPPLKRAEEDMVHAP